MKKLIRLLLLSGMIAMLAFAGCGQAKKGEDTKGQGTTDNEKENGSEDVEKELTWNYIEGFYTINIRGQNKDLFLGPDGIFYGNNYKIRGKESERQVTVAISDPSGQIVVRQTCGIRIYGGASRENYLKSIKLYAREEYDAENKQFAYDFFSSNKRDGSGETIDSYKRLVVRNCGNDFQFAWIRDELVQCLAAKSGFEFTEAVAPAVLYINSEYRGLYWLHESYCDYYFKTKYGKKNRDGEFVVLEGSETHKNVDEDEGLSQNAANEFNFAYDYFSDMDMTIEDNYKQLCEFMDVENYLQYYAINLYVNNHDWPWNNYKCFRYYASDGEQYDETGVYDGRWRFLLHDSDYSMGLYDQRETMASYDSLGGVMNSKDTNGDFANYSPLFTKLMKREDCRQFFIDYTRELMTGVFSPDNMLAMLDLMNDGRATAMEKHLSYMESLRRQGKPGIWAGKDNLEDQLNKIRQFVKDRPAYAEKYLKLHLGAK